LCHFTRQSENIFWSGRGSKYWGFLLRLDLAITTLPDVAMLACDKDFLAAS
jgi:hypothetical protein